MKQSRETAAEAAKSAPWKVALALRLRRETGASIAWMAKTPWQWAAPTPCEATWESTGWPPTVRKLSEIGLTPFRLPFRGYEIRPDLVLAQTDSLLCLAFYVLRWNLKTWNAFS
jgi:hypothetical protein